MPSSQIAVASYLEPIITRAERIPVAPAGAVKSSPSLRPGLAMMEACVYGNEEAIAIRDAWRFKEPVVVVSFESYELMVQRGTVTFHG